MEYLSRSKLGSDAGRSARRVLRERVNQRQGGWVQMSLGGGHMSKADYFVIAAVGETIMYCHNYQ